MSRTFFGFGFGPIQSALFLLEAYNSGNFSRFVVSEIDAHLVQAVRANGGAYSVNIARCDRIDQVTVRGVDLLNPREEQDRKQIVQAIGEAEEMATALPSVQLYGAGGATSVVSLLAEGLKCAQRPAVLYAAENNNRAAEVLEEQLKGAAGAMPAEFQICNTVIGKMSGVMTDPEVIENLNLVTVTPDSPRAILVEEFNHILISRIELPRFRRGIEVFVEKPDLLPFEEAKLYGHNAIHAVMGYLSDLRDLTYMSEARAHGDIMEIGRRAFVDESGQALISRHRGLNDRLFTPEGYAEYAEDLLARMTNPHLNDAVERVGRDHARKLGYDDRIYGTMHLALDEGVQPENLAKGAAAGVLSFIKRCDTAPDGIEIPATANELTRPALEKLLNQLWEGHDAPRAGEMIELTWEALQPL